MFAMWIEWLKRKCNICSRRKEYYKKLEEKNSHLKQPIHLTIFAYAPYCELLYEYNIQKFLE